MNGGRPTDALVNWRDPQNPTWELAPLESSVRRRWLGAKTWEDESLREEKKTLGASDGWEGGG